MSSSLASPAHHNWKDLRAFGWALPTLCWLSPTPMWHTGSQTPSGGLCVSLPKARLGLANSTAPMGKRGSRDRGVTDPRHHAERSRHHTKDKQRFVVSVIAYDSLPGHQGPFRPCSFSSAPARRSARTLVKSGVSSYIDARYGSRPSEGIRRLRVHCGYTGRTGYTGWPPDCKGAFP